MARSFVARRMQGLVQSDIRRLTIECNRVGGINLGQGICDLPTPPSVMQGAVEAIGQNRAIYTHAMGLPELRARLSSKLADFNGIEADPETEICITVGSSGAFAAGVFATLNPGDEVVLLEPFYGYHLNTLLLAGITPRYARLDLATMRPDIDSLEAAITEKTKAIVLCTPSNPSGVVLSREDLDRIGELARQRDLLLFSDEIYEYIVYDDRRHVSPASLPSLRDRVLTLGGYSKTFSITGWRIGYLAGPAEIMSRAAVCSDLLYVCAPHPLQLGVLKGLDSPAGYYEEMRDEYQRGRDLLCDALSEAGFQPCVPHGSYYVMADFRKLGWTDDQQASRELLDRAKVAAIPGGAFFEPGSGRGRLWLRFCFAKERSVLEEACRRIRSLTA